jgi:hypothetical protein
MPRRVWSFDQHIANLHGKVHDGGWGLDGTSDWKHPASTVQGTAMGRVSIPLNSKVSFPTLARLVSKTLDDQGAQRIDAALLRHDEK